MKNKKLILSISLACGIFAIILLFDLLSKYFITKKLPNTGDGVDVIPGFINFIYVQNTGAAWGMLAGRPVFLIIISLIILAVYLWFYYLRLKKLKNKTSIILSISVGLIAGGCIGNLVDRIAFGYVRDFINFQFIDFPVFNVADISLTIGIIIMIIYFVFIYSKEDRKIAMSKVEVEKLLDMSEVEKIDEEISRLESNKDSNSSIDKDNNLPVDSKNADDGSKNNNSLQSGDNDER